MQNAVGTPDFIDVTAEQTVHKFQNFLIFGKDDMRANVIFNAVFFISTAKAAERVILFQNADFTDVGIFLQIIGQGYCGETPAEYGIIHLFVSFRVLVVQFFGVGENDNTGYSVAERTL